VKTTHKPNDSHEATFITFGSDEGGYDQWQQEVSAFLAQGGMNLVNDADALIKGGVQLASVTNINTPQQSPPQSAWGNQQSAQNGPQLHPSGESCSLCGKTLVANTTRTGKKQWVCPDYRYSNGQSNGHRCEWV